VGGTWQFVEGREGEMEMEGSGQLTGAGDEGSVEEREGELSEEDASEGVNGGWPSV
jgi:hypothetical protein